MTAETRGYQRPLATSDRARGLGRIDIPGTKYFLKWWLSYPGQVVILNQVGKKKRMAELLVSRPLLPTPAKTFHNQSVNESINRVNLVGKPRSNLTIQY